jgi:hypothetical protein
MLRGRQLWWMWCRWATVGEAVDFCVPAVAGVAAADAPAAVSLPVLIAAGVAEGAVLGVAQAHVLTWAIRGLSVRRWVTATALAAGLAWLIGMLPSLFGGALRSLPAVVVLAVALAGGAVMLLSIGTAQWWVLRARVAGASRWIAGTAGAWLAGLSSSFWWRCRCGIPVRAAS